MSTSAAVFYMNPVTGKYHGITINYDGYLEGVGKTLLDHWNGLEKAEKLCNSKRTDGRCLNDDEVEYFEDEGPDRYKKFQTLSQNQAIEEGKQWDNLYIYEPLCKNEEGEYIGWNWYHYNKNEHLLYKVKELLEEK